MNKPAVLIDEETIRRRVSGIAQQVNREYEGKGSVVLVGVLKGAFILLSDLARQLTIPHSVEFIAVSSYGKKGADSGAVRMLMDVREDIENRHVLVVEWEGVRFRRGVRLLRRRCLGLAVGVFAITTTTVLLLWCLRMGLGCLSLEGVLWHPFRSLGWGASSTLFC